ncbi:odorant receptor 22c [Solenopsis invicta]|uniref:odorant receptor 22c n=1 Tax=Solenopsis invicta TaxID=13686 RepID=UPI00193D6FBC|nr:odorant receptor 22c [Solenopsis invicta]
MSVFDNRYYSLNKRLLSLIGQWPFQSRWEGNMRLAFASLFVFSLISFEFWGLLAGLSDLSIIMENGSPLLINCYIITRLINCVFTKNKMKILLEDIEETWKIKCAGAEKEILQRYAKISRTFTRRLTFAIYLTWVIYVLTPLVVTWIYKLLPIKATYTARFLYRIEHVLDVDKYYNLLMLHGAVSIFYILSASVAISTAFIACTLHICALFECLRYNVERVQSTDPVLLEPNIKDDETYHDLVDCIKSYKHALKLSDVLSSNYTVSYFISLGNVMLSLSFGTAELVMVDLQMDEIIRIVTSNLAQLLHLYCLCTIAQRLTDRSSEFQDVIYSCDWYNMSLRSKRLVMITLMRANKPCYVKAGKLFVMSLETFSSILKLSLSYFTVLTSLQKE